MLATDIDYRLIGKAIEFLVEQRGFTYVEAPWLVDREATLTTLPEHYEHLAFTDGTTYHVGSAEQGLIYMHRRGLLAEDTYYVAAGPCVRNEPRLDELHQRTFFKIELYCALSENNAEHDILDYFVYTSQCLHQHLFGEELKVDLIPTNDGRGIFDLEIGGIEVGSYGSVWSNRIGKSWVYGTGLALPRASVAVNKLLNRP